MLVKTKYTEDILGNENATFFILKKEKFPLQVHKKEHKNKGQQTNKKYKILLPFFV